MMELTINGNVYSFNFGFGFMKDLNAKVQIPVEGVPGKTEQIGMRYEIARLIDGSVDALVTILFSANKGQDPRLTQKTIEAYIEDPDTDVDGLFQTVIDFLSRANVTKKETQNLLEAVKEQ